MAKNNNLGDFLTDIANNIRTVKGTSSAINAQDFSTQISTMYKQVPSGNIQLTTSSSTNVKDYATATVKGGSATTPATTISSSPSISVSSGGLITASNSKTQNITPSVSAGWVNSGTAGTITVSGSNTKQLTTKGATTYTPTTSNQTIASGTYLTGTQTISGSSNLVAGNIKQGVDIFGVVGTFAGGGTITKEIIRVDSYETATISKGNHKYVFVLFYVSEETGNADAYNITIGNRTKSISRDYCLVGLNGCVFYDSTKTSYQARFTYSWGEYLSNSNYKFYTVENSSDVNSAYSNVLSLNPLSEYTSTIDLVVYYID